MNFNQNSKSETRDYLFSKLKRVVPEFEIESKVDAVYRINQLKQEHKALVLGHNYMEPALYHGVADHTGDSLQLCQIALKSDHPILVYLGVEFMAESAKILNPDRKVLIPSQKAGCSLAASITAQDVRDLKAKYPGVPVVTYINTYADVKAETDVCCTSSNAASIVKKLGTDHVIFIPDEYLAQNVANETGVNVIFPQLGGDQKLSEKTFISWKGKCEVHDQFTVEDIEDVRRQYPDVFVLAHPECPADVVDASDFSGSTSAMINKVKSHDAKQYLLLTECAMGDNIIAEMPDKSEKEVLRLCSVRCPHMAQITLKDTEQAIIHHQYEITVPEEIRIRAKRSIDRMLEMS